jgi:hypothetical protein
MKHYALSIPNLVRCVSWFVAIFGFSARCYSVNVGLQVLKTAVSALHMLRYNAQDFGFHVLPASLAPRVTTGAQGHHHFERGGRSADAPAELPDGCGTLVLVNKRVAKDRAMVVIVRPPWLIGSAELKDFAKSAVSADDRRCQSCELLKEP